MLQSKLLQAIPNLEHGFTSRKTEKEKLEQLTQRVFTMKQTHKDSLYWMEKALLPDGKPEADAVATIQKNIAIGVNTADCCPILAAAVDSKNQAQAVLAVHAGWRGTALEIATKSIQSFHQQISLQTKIQKLLICIGPAISQKHFEVGQDVIDALPLMPKSAIGKKNGQEKFFADLEAENIRQLETSLPQMPIAFELEAMSICTYDDPEIFPSYRRDGSTGERILSYLKIIT